MKFLRNLLAVLVGLFIFFGGGFLLLLGIAAGGSDLEPLTSSSVLHLKLSGPLVERSQPNPFEGLVPIDIATPIGLQQVKEALSEASTDPNIEGVLLEPYLFSAGWASMREIRQAIQKFREESGKFVIAYSELYTEGDYYVASAADVVYLHPEGDLEFNGLSQEVTFIKGTLDKLGVEAQVFRVGTYKSAVEPFFRTSMSEASREQMESYMNAMYQTVLNDISDSRGVDAPTLSNVSDKMLVRSPKDAQTQKLVDGLKYYDEVLAQIREKTDRSEDDEITFVTLNRYLTSFSLGTTYGADRIAVIVGEGNIASGKSSDGTIGSDSYAREIRKARDNDRVKAIVLRINSPGGSALASDIIWREVLLASEVKPVIASMGDVAASGGYYMAMAADKIVAQPNTITGSIGIFGVLFNAEELLRDKLGVTTDPVNTGELSDLFRMTRPLTDFEKSIIQKQVEESYESFTSKAAQGRGMSIEALKAVASGRVWAGTEALEHGLVDELGSLDDAIALAAEMAEMTGDYMVKYYPEQKDVLEEFLSGMTGGEYQERILQAELGELYPLVRQVQNIQQYRGVQARLPYEIEIH